MSPDFNFSNNLTSITSQITSFSGADYKFLLYIPSGIGGNRIFLQEIEKELAELQSIYDQTTNTSERNQIEKLIDELKKVKAAEEQKKEGFSISLDDLQTVSFQVHADKQPVRGLGSSYPRGYTCGSRLCAGSMIFTVLREHPLIKVIDAINKNPAGLLSSTSRHQVPNALTSYDLIPTSATADHLPPLHLNIIGVNEGGSACITTLFGVQFINDGMVMSIQNIVTESTLTFVAQDIDIMRTLDTKGIANIPAFSRSQTVSEELKGPVAALRRVRRGLPF